MANIYLGGLLAQNFWHLSNDISFLLGGLETSMASNRFSKVSSKIVILEDLSKSIVVLVSSHIIL